MANKEIPRDLRSRRKSGPGSNFTRRESSTIKKVLDHFQVKYFDTCLQFEERNSKKNPRKRGDDETSISSSSSDSAQSISGVSSNKEEGKPPPAP
jgi:hypothetical protein